MRSCSLGELPSVVTYSTGYECCHRFIGTSCLSLAVTALSLLAASTLERVCFRLDFSRTKRLEEIVFHNFAVRCLSLFRCHFLAGHVAESVYGQIAAHNALAEARVVLVLQVNEERSNLCLVRPCCAAELRDNGTLDSLRARHYQLARCTRVGSKSVVKKLDALVSCLVTSDISADAVGLRSPQLSLRANGGHCGCQRC